MIMSATSCGRGDRPAVADIVGARCVFRAFGDDHPALAAHVNLESVERF